MVTKLSIFLPAFNEEKNLGPLLDSVSSFLKKNLSQYEIIVVDDGSTDNTQRLVSEISSKDKFVHLVKHQTNLGYGQAIKTGIEAARYPWVFFMDSDGQFDINNLKEFLVYDQYDLVIGYRIKRDDPLNRLLASRVYGLFVKTLFGLKVKDIDCAFKMMRKEQVESLGIVSNSFFASTELLVRAQRNGLKIKEIGVHHYPRKEGKSTVTINRVWQSLVELKNLYFKLHAPSN